MRRFYHTFLNEKPARNCSTCGVLKTLEENFSKSNKSKTGYKARCKECVARIERTGPRETWEEVASKICPRCARDKPIDDFSLSKRTRNGHASWCKECAGEYAKAHEYRKKRTEREKKLGKDFAQKQYAISKRWREKNLDVLRVQWRKKYATDPEHAARMRQNSEKWRKNHPLEWRAKQMKREARERNAAIGPVDLQSVLSRHGRRCYICDQEILPTQKLAFDHVIPLVPHAGDPQGTHTEDNLRPTHDVCNKRKFNRRLDQLTEFDRRGPSK